MRRSSVTAAPRLALALGAGALLFGAAAAHAAIPADYYVQLTARARMPA